MTDYVKKVEGVKRDGQAKALAKRAMNSGNFQGSYSRGSGQPTRGQANLVRHARLYR